MEAEQGRAFRISAILHGIFFAALLLAAIPQSCTKQPELHVFSVVAPPSAHSEPEPIPTPPKEAIAQPQPAPKPKPKPVVKKETPAPAPQKMSYAEFVKKEGKPKPPSPKPKPRPQKAPKINTQAITDELRAVVTTTDSKQQKQAELTPADLSAIEAYNRKLRQRIDLVWEKPSDGEDLRATVQFSVTRSGDIQNIRVVRSSGNPLFDRSIEQAFSKIGNAGPPPGSRPGTYQVSFS